MKTIHAPHLSGLATGTEMRDPVAELWSSFTLKRSWDTFIQTRRTHIRHRLYQLEPQTSFPTKGRILQQNLTRSFQSFLPTKFNYSKTGSRCSSGHYDTMRDGRGQRHAVRRDEEGSPQYFPTGNVTVTQLDFSSVTST